MNVSGDSPLFILSRIAFVLLLICFITGGCRRDGNHNHGDPESHAARLESQDRAVWQQPNLVLRFSDVRRGMNIADIGAGTGYFTRRFSAAIGPEGRVIGYDISPDMIDRLKKDAADRGLDNTQAVLIQEDNPGFPLATFDLVFMCNTYHHIENRIAYFKKLRQALKPGGRIILVEFRKEKMPVGPPPEMKLKREQILEEMKQAGFVLHRESKELKYQYLFDFRTGSLPAN